MKRAITAILVLSLTACAADEPELQTDGVAEAATSNSIWMDPKLHGAKINASIAAWRRDFEAQAQLHQVIDASPNISSITPATVNRGQSVTIDGQNFSRMTRFGQVFSVSFQAGSVRSLANVTSMTDTRIVVTVPANATTGMVQLINPGNGNSVWAESPLPLTVNVPAPTTGIVRFTNDSQFEVHSLTVNGVEKIPFGQYLAPTDWIEVVAPGSTLPFHAQLGFGSFVDLEFDGSATFTNGLTANLSIRRVRAADVFTFGQTFAWFDGPWYDNNFAPHSASMKIFSNGNLRALL